MEQIPQKYLLSTNSKEAMAAIRSLLDSGLTVQKMARQLTDRYSNSRTAGRVHIGLMLTSVYDFEEPKIANECAKKFGIWMHPGFSAGQSAYMEDYEEGKTLYWRRKYTRKVTSWQPLVEEFDTDRWKYVTDPEMKANILTIDKADHIFAAMNSDGSFGIFVLEDCPHDILIDENDIFDEAPLYFTESAHFVSPVFKARLAKRILDYCLMETGYPHVPIYLTVIYTSTSAFLINAEDYEEGGEHAPDWQGVRIAMLKDTLPGYALTATRNFFSGCGAQHSPEEQMRLGFVNSLAATSILYDAVRRSKMELRLTPKVLAKLAGEERIFT